MMVYNGIDQFDEHNVEHGCFICVHRAVCEKEHLKQHNIVCGNYLCERLVATYAPPITNTDRIRAMSDEEIAKLILDWVQTGACNDFGVPVTGNCNGKCVECIVEWLKQPAEEKA